MSQCFYCQSPIDDKQIPEDLRYSPRFCTRRCAQRSGMDMRFDGKGTVSPSYIMEDAMSQQDATGAAPDVGGVTR